MPEAESFTDQLNYCTAYFPQRWLGACWFFAQIAYCLKSKSLLLQQRTDKKAASLGVATLLLGQIVWAASQAAVLLATAHTSSYEIIGSFSVGLSIFAPLCLLTG